MLSPNSGCLTTHAVEYFNKFINRATGLLALTYLVMLSLNKVFTYLLAEKSLLYLVIHPTM